MEPERELVREPRAETHAVLQWTCLGCGMRWSVAMPGYPGTGYDHYVNSNPDQPCGPLIAVREPGFKRA